RSSAFGISNWLRDSSLLIVASLRKAIPIVLYEDLLQSAAKMLSKLFCISRAEPDCLPVLLFEDFRIDREIAADVLAAAYVIGVDMLKSDTGRGRFGEKTADLEDAEYLDISDKLARQGNGP